MQIHRQFRKPLVVFAPKNLLRHPLAKSPLTDFDDQPDDKGIVVSVLGLSLKGAGVVMAVTSSDAAHWL